ncbi:flagellar biosynthesis regulator FlaF [Microvirga roseola]|uniref:flagellar biosynthesis regulator FlaF n=1 Tax=Microvirga roseola TaxID=2883126 RepID=UPI001E35A36D|nr:flagellar biosynthesis regulator FlaF [Microvirga roseola]
MYRFSYAEVLDDSATEGRRREQDLFSKVLDLLKKADGHPSDSREMMEAMYFVQRLWVALIKDLGHPDNGLPDMLKGQLISIGLWVMRESDRIVRGETSDVTGLIDINTIIRDGLK